MGTIKALVSRNFMGASMNDNHVLSYIRPSLVVSILEGHINIDYIVKSYVHWQSFEETTF